MAVNFSNDATTTCSKHNNNFEKAGFGAATGNPKPCKLHRQQSNVQSYALGFKPSGGQLFQSCNQWLKAQRQQETKRRHAAEYRFCFQYLFTKFTSDQKTKTTISAAGGPFFFSSIPQQRQGCWRACFAKDNIFFFNPSSGKDARGHSLPRTSKVATPPEAALFLIFFY